MEEDKDLVQEQIDYYRARAGEYDDWFFRKGRYDRGPEQNGAWFRDVQAVSEEVDEWVPTGRVLELAAGTGLWTEQLAARATHVTAVDASSEVLHVNRNRLEAHASRVTYVLDDLFAWTPDGLYDGVFFAFWLSHVPAERFDAFWNFLRSCLVPNGSVFFVDSRYDPTSTARDHRLEGENATSVVRRLDDGREFRIVKRFYRAQPLSVRLAALGWKIQVEETERYFIFGRGCPES